MMTRVLAFLDDFVE